MAVIAKLLSTVFRIVQVLGTLFNTGCITYFIVGLSNRNLINGRALAVEIISAAGLVWSVFALVFSICLLQKSFFQFFTVFGDVLFIGGFIAVAVLLRNAWDGDCSANNIIIPWLERGGHNLTANCRIIKGIFIVAIILCVLFFLTTLTSILAHRSSKKDRAYGPSPANNYTSGRGKRNKNRDLETATVGGPALVPPAVDNRISHESKYTDTTDKTNEPVLQTGTTGTTGREYLAPRGYAGTEATVSPIASNPNLRSNDHSHAGQYAMAGALAGGAAAAHHQHKKNAYAGNHDNLPSHPGPEDHTTEHIPQDPDRLGTMNTYNTNSAYSELDTGPPSTYHTPGVYPGSKGSVQPTAFYPAANSNNPHFYSSEMEAGGYQPHPHAPLEPQELGTTATTRRYEEYQTPVTPLADENREEVGFGYGNGPGMTGGGSNQISTLPELGREDGRRF
ncbi:hypothetical protein TWF730_008092 [Orbilia blumenaviensis]|uniref:MARVEL domain-containing protein n=1 Tax=Orbilia blumenaviensis TaxID=1796055 RepID=A0AAV9VCM9_9PEZI